MKKVLSLLLVFTMLLPSLLAHQVNAAENPYSNGVQDLTVHWWGRKFFLSRSKTAGWIKELNRSSLFAGGLAAALRFVGAGGLGFMTAIVGLSYRSMANSLQNRLNATKNRGTIYNAHLTGTWSTAVQ